MIIRPAEYERDAAGIMAGVRDFIGRMHTTAFLPASEAELAAAVHRVVTSPGVEVDVAEHHGGIVGGLGMFVGPFLWNPARLVAEELFWWSAPGAPPTAALRLLRSAVDRARVRGAIVSFKRLTSSPAGVERIYRRLGLTEIETTFAGAF